MPKGFFLCISLWCCICAAFTPACNAEAPARATVRIGVIVPFSGGLSHRGEDVARLIEILKPHLDARSRRYRYEFEFDDGACGLGNSATSAAMKFINVDKIKFLITGCSGETLQVGPIAQRAQVIDFAVLSNHPDVRTLGDCVFRTFLDIEPGVIKLAAYLKAHVAGKIAILAEENAFTLVTKRLLIKYLGAQAGYSEDFNAGSGDFRSLLARVKQSGAKGLYLSAMSVSSVAAQIRQARDLKLSMPIFTYTMPEDADYIRLTGKSGEGVVFIGYPDIAKSSDEYQAIHSEYMRRHPIGPSYEIILRTTFDALKSITDAVEEVGPHPAKVKEFLKSYRAEGAQGPIAYDTQGDLKDIAYALRMTTATGHYQLPNPDQFVAGGVP